MARSHAEARFTDPMLLLRTDRLPEGATWQCEIKLDGYRAIAFKSGGRVQLRSRNDKEFGGKYPAIVKALASMPDETVIDRLISPNFDKVSYHRFTFFSVLVSSIACGLQPGTRTDTG